MTIKYNAPVSLSFSLASFAILLIAFLTAGASTRLLFSVYGPMVWTDIFAWLRLFGHVLGHASWEHLFSNLAFLLLLGPILEEKYGSLTVLWMILITAFVTAIFNLLLFSTGLLGASGIVFMFILLTSFTNIRSGEIPLTFIAIVTLYLAHEIIGAFQKDDISQFAHLIGGACGGIFGFLLINTKTRS